MAVATEHSLPKLTRPDDVLEWARRLVSELDLTLTIYGNEINAGGGGGGGSVTSVTAGTGIVATPNPIIGIGTIELADTAVTPGAYGDATSVAQITVDQQGRITAAANVTITGVTPGGSAGGDLSGSYPNPNVVDDSHNHTAVTLPSSIVYDGDAAGGDLSGTYPNPSVVDDSHNHTAATLSGVIASGAAAGGDLSGTYPNPSVVDDSHNHSISTLTGVQPLDADLTAIAAFSSTGIAVRTAANTWAQRSITAGSGIAVTNGSGAAADPAVALDINGLTVETTLAGTDTFPFYDASASANRKMTVNVLASNLNALSLLDHGSLSGLTPDDDHGHYTQKTGRTGSTNDTTLSTSTGGVLYGSSASSQPLSIQSTSHSTRGLVNVVDEMRLRTGLGTFTGATYLAQGVLAADTADTIVEYGGIKISGTLRHTAGIVLALGYLFNAEPTVEVEAGANLPAFFALRSAPTMVADGTNITAGTSIGYGHTPIYNAVGIGITATGIIDNVIDAGLTSNLGVTVATRRGLNFRDSNGTGAVTEQVAVEVASLAKATTNISLRSQGNNEMRHQGPAMFGNSGGPATGDGRVVEIERTFTLTGALSEGYAATLTLDPGYTSVGANTVTRHNYFDVQNVSVAGSAAVTDACIFRFDAVVGTHKALASPGAVAVTLGTGPTGANAGNPLGWMKINVNGVVRFMPFW